MQVTDWPAALLSSLARHRPLILFDNRDAGLSQLFGPRHDHEIRESDFPDANPPSTQAPYTLFDMADDGVRLLDALGIPKVHVVGFSMGGMIAQLLGARHPDRVLSITGLMTSAGQPWLESTADADRMMRRSIVTDSDGLVDFLLQAEDIYAGPTALPDTATRRELIRAAIARGHHSAGIWRQALAMRAAGDRRGLVRSIVAPLLMLHGEQDPVIALRQAAAIAELLPAARFIELSQTGHVLTEDNGAVIADIISAFWQSLLTD